jgi:hypothetical protein
MKVELLVPWRQWNKGHVIPEMPAAQAEVMVQRGFAKYVKDVVRSPVREVMAAGRSYVTKKKG